MKKIIIIAVIVLVAMFAGCINTNQEPTKWREYVVHYGDTVYDISIDITPNGMDYREISYYIIEKNNIENALIYPGQTILIPIYE